jgi:hypothetical protein
MSCLNRSGTKVGDRQMTFTIESNSTHFENLT